VNKFAHAPAVGVAAGPSESPAGLARHAASDVELALRALRWSEVFSHWPQERLLELMAHARLKRYSRRTQVLTQSRHRRDLLAVVSGCIEISRSNAGGQKHVVALVGPGQVAPLIRLLEDVPLGYDYHAHEDSVIIHVAADAVLAVLDAEPVLWRDVARLALKRQRGSVMVLQALALGSLRCRVASILLSLSQSHGEREAQGLDLRLRVSQHDLAALLGLSRQTISKQLRALAEAGVIEMRYKRILVLDRNALSRIASAD